MFSLLSLALGATPDCPYGVNAHQASDAVLEAAAEAGIGWVRFDMNWNQFEPEKGQYNWTVGDRFMAKAEALELNVFVTVAYTPDWAATVSCNESSSSEWDWCHNAPTSAEHYARFVTAAVQRYPTVKHWGMWNEPNLSHFYRGTRDQWAQTILIPGSEAVHDACSDCKVLGPDLANLREAHWDSDEGICAFGECIFNGWNYSLEQILKSYGQHIDIVTHHKYTDPAEVFWSELTVGQWLMEIQYMNGLQELTDHHVPGKPVWITEFGWETTPGGEHSPEYSSQQLKAAFQGLGDQANSWPELEVLFWYDLVDDPNTYSWGAFTWGLLEADGTPKPAMASYAALIGDACVEPEEEEEPEPEDTGSAQEPEDTDDGSQEEEDDDPSEEQDSASPAGLEKGPSTESGCSTAPAASGLLLLAALFLRRI